MSSDTTTWSNWCGLTQVQPRDTLTPTSSEELAAAIADAATNQRRLKMPGTGHSFTSIAEADDILVRSSGLQGIIGMDLENLTVTARAGTRLKDLNSSLERLGFSLHNMGDIAEQTIAGATSTGTHGTGGVAAGLSAQIVGLELVTGTGEILKCSAEENAEVFEFARVGLGALGILTTLTFKVEPLFTLEAHEKPMSWQEITTNFDQYAEENHYFEFYYWPHTDSCQAKFNNRTLDAAQPLSKMRRRVDDDFLSNNLFSALVKAGQAMPNSIPRINQVCGKALSERTYSDVPWKVFTSPRLVRFREMEYAVPREVGIEALTEARALIDRSGWRIGFPIEVRHAPADDIPLSSASGRDTVYLAFHVPMKTDHREYFGGIEAIMRDFGGRPHWGKLHTRSAGDLAPVYPKWDDFISLRDRLDPHRVFANGYLDQVLGS
jgi:FAD-linked oxidoreductase